MEKRCHGYHRGNGTPLRVRDECQERERRSRVTFNRMGRASARTKREIDGGVRVRLENLW